MYRMRITRSNMYQQAKYVLTFQRNRGFELRKTSLDCVSFIVLFAFHASYIEKMYDLFVIFRFFSYINANCQRITNEILLSRCMNITDHKTLICLETWIDQNCLFPSRIISPYKCWPVAKQQRFLRESNVIILQNKTEAF